MISYISFHTICFIFLSLFLYHQNFWNFSDSRFTTHISYLNLLFHCYIWMQKKKLSSDHFFIRLVLKYLVWSSPMFFLNKSFGSRLLALFCFKIRFFSFKIRFFSCSFSILLILSSNCALSFKFSRYYCRWFSRSVDLVSILIVELITSVMAMESAFGKHFSISLFLVFLSKSSGGHQEWIPHFYGY